MSLMDSWRDAKVASIGITPGGGAEGIKSLFADAHDGPTVTAGTTFTPSTFEM